MKRQLERLLTTCALTWERLTRRRSRYNVNGDAPRHVLVLHFPVTVGIAVHELPLLEALKQLHPAPCVSVATTGAGLELLRASPFVDSLIPVPKPSVNLRASVKALGTALAAQPLPVDCVLLGAFDRQRAVVRLAWLATRGWRGGFVEHARLLQRPLAYDDHLGVIENNLRVAGLLGWEGTPLLPRIFVTPATLAYAQGLLGDDSRPTLTIISQASEQSSCWVPERMAAVLRHARDQLGFRVFLDGTAPQAAAIEFIIRASHGPATSLAGRTSLSQVAAVCAMSDLVLAVDTGTTHIARATGVPTLILMPAWEDPHDWHALPEPAVERLYKGSGEPQAPDYAMEEFAVEEVLGAVQALMDRYPPSAQARAEREQRLVSARDHLAGV